MTIEDYWARMFVRGVAISFVSMGLIIAMIIMFSIPTTLFADVPLLGLLVGLLFAIIVFLASFVILGRVATWAVEKIR